MCGVCVVRMCKCTKCVQFAFNLHLNCVYNSRSLRQNCITYFRTAVLPYCRIAILLYFHIAILPYCRIVYTQLPDIAIIMCICFYHRVHMLQVYGKHSKDRSTPETKTTQASENGKKVFHPNFISWSYR